MVTMGSPESRQRWLTCQMLKGGSGIDQSPIKKHPAG
jgi:hypothetical protein